MKKLFFTACLCFAAGFMVCTVLAKSLTPKQEGYIVQHEKDIAKNEPGPHNGGGATIGYTFFAGAEDFKITFKKRVLYPGASIGYHLQKEDEVYYIMNGSGTMEMNGKTFSITSGDAILTRGGSSHGLKATGENDLDIIIVYEKK